MKKLMILTLLAFGFAACGTEDISTDTKPQGDPDNGVLEGKADRLSNRYTTIVGALEDGTWTNGYIDFPDWFHGHTIELQAGETMNFRLDAKAEGVVRLYGPSVRVASNGEPKFRRAVVRSWASHQPNNGPGEVSADFDFEVETTGTYMLVYGPYYKWESKYSILAECVAACRQPGECLSNAECGDGEACLDNGVRCVQAPCTANFNTCQAVDDGACNDDSDCDDGWCRPVDSTFTAKECVPFSVEGGPCSGFAPPQYINQCDADHSCVFRPFVADAPGTCRLNVTVKELRDNPGAYKNKRVSIDAYVNTGYAICTLQACPRDNPCCNSCGASQKLSDTVGTGNVDGLTLIDTNGELGCGGNNCTYQDNCSVTDGRYRIVGVFGKEFSDYKIDVESKTDLTGSRF